MSFYDVFGRDAVFAPAEDVRSGVVQGPTGTEITGTLVVTGGGSLEISDTSLEKLSEFLKTEKTTITDPCPPGVIRATQSEVFTQDFETGYSLATFSKLMFSVKSSLKDEDTNSLILGESDPNTVLRLLREAPDSTDGISFSVSPSPIVSGIRVVIESPLMSLLESGTLYYCLKGLDPDRILSQGKLILSEAGIDTVTPL